MASVELYQAWRWDCPNCGYEHFERGAHIDLSPHEMAEIELAMGAGDVVAMPDAVTCGECGQNFEVEQEP